MVQVGLLICRLPCTRWSSMRRAAWGGGLGGSQTAELVRSAHSPPPPPP